MPPRPKSRCYTSPQQRSDLARKAAQTRWARHHNLPPDSFFPEPPPSPELHIPDHAFEWINTRFCLRLEQDHTGAWLLLTPAGLRIPASPAEISLWLDLQSLIP